MSVAQTVDHEASLVERFCRLASKDLELMAALHAVEPDSETIDSLRACGFPDNLGLVLQSEEARDAAAVMRGALAEMPDAIDDQLLDELAADFADIYLTGGLRASPCESVWLDVEHLERQAPMFQVREHYTREGLGAADWRRRPDDHLVIQLQFIARLLKQSSARGERDRLGDVAQFMDEHLLRWLGDFCNRVAQRCATPFFAGLALVTASYCEALRDLLVEPRPERDASEQETTSPGSEVSVNFVPGVGPTV